MTSASLGGLSSRSLPLVRAVIIKDLRENVWVESEMSNASPNPLRFREIRVQVFLLLRLQLAASRRRQNATPTPGSSNCRAPAMGELS